VINTILADNSIFEIIGKNCKNLEILKICFFSGIQRDMRISANLINLKSLTVKRNPEVKSYFINSVAKVCKELLFLDIEGKFSLCYIQL
jgi:hypothetical protein